MVHRPGVTTNQLNPNYPAPKPEPLSWLLDFIERMPRFLIDTGSELNIVKSKLLKPSVPIQKETLYRLAGITEGLTETFGYVNLKINGIHCRLNVVSNDFPIEADGILGTEFLKEQDAVLSFKEETLLYGNPQKNTPFVSHDTVSLPARGKTLIKVTIQNSTRSNG